MGGDYLLTDGLVVGGALAYGRTEADLSGGSTMDVDTVTLLAYGSWEVADSLYLDGKACPPMVVAESWRPCPAAALVTGVNESPALIRR